MSLQQFYQSSDFFFNPKCFNVTCFSTSGNSPLAARLMRLWFVKETESNSIAEINRMKAEFQSLQNYDLNELGSIDFTPLLTMMDNKAENSENLT